MSIGSLVLELQSLLLPVPQRGYQNMVGGEERGRTTSVACRAQV